MSDRSECLLPHPHPPALPSHAFHASGAKHAVHLSSVAVYGNVSAPVDEGFPTDSDLPPNDLYARSKREAEELLTQVPERLYIDSYVALAGSQLALLNLTGDETACNELYFSVWNDNERALSATLRFQCWFDQPLSVVSPLFRDSFLASLPNDPSRTTRTGTSTPLTSTTTSVFMTLWIKGTCLSPMP